MGQPDMPDDSVKESLRAGDRRSEKNISFARYVRDCFLVTIGPEATDLRVLR